MKREIRYYQQNAYDAVFAAMKRGRKRVLITMPGGTGKTFTCANIIKEFGRKLWITHEESLAEQSAIAILTEMEILPEQVIIDTINEHDGLINLLSKKAVYLGDNARKIFDNVGIVKAELFDIDKPLVVASAQTLYKRLSKIPPDWFDVIVCDEGDLFGSRSFKEPLDTLTPKLIIGATATGFRTDGMLMEDIFEEIVYDYPIEQAIADKYLTDINAIVVRTSTDLSEVHSARGDFNQKELVEKVNTPERNFLIVNKYIEYCSGQQFICFGADVQHVIDLHECFQMKGITTAYVVSDKDRMVVGTDRKSIVRAYKKGELMGLVNYNVFSAGFDHKDCGCIDEETEILTPDGWKGIDDKFNKVISYNVKNRNLENVKVLARTITERKNSITYKGSCYDINVTEDHRMLTETGRIGSGFYFENAEVDLLKERRRLPVSGNAINKKDINVSDLELRFIAWFITDGGYSRERTVQICQAKEPTIIIIRQLLNDLGYTYKEYIKKVNTGFHSTKPLYYFRVAKGVKVKGFESLRKYLNKSLSKELTKMSKRQFKLFWDELILGDGWHYKNTPRNKSFGTLCCANSEFVKNIQELATRCGYFTNAIKIKKLKSGKDFWTISLSDKRFIEVRTIDKRVTKTKKTEVFVKKEVHSNKKYWCIQNKNETIITRRNGKIAILGNCVILGCPTQSKRKFLQQLYRVTRLKTEAFVKKFGQIGTVLDIVDGTSRHKLINTHELDKGKPIEDRVFLSKENKQLLIDARIERDKTFVTTFRKEDKVVDLFKLPEIKISDSLRMGEMATEAQLGAIAKWGYDTINEVYTKSMISEIFGKQPASPKSISFLRFKGYDCSGFVSVAQAAAASKEILARENKAEINKKQGALKSNLPFKF